MVNAISGDDVTLSVGVPRWSYVGAKVVFNRWLTGDIMIIEITYASAPSSDMLIPTLEFNNETAGVIRLDQ